MTGSSPPRSVALAIFRLAPAGGLEQHCLRLAAILAARGCSVTLITTRAPVIATDAAVEVILARGRTNHARLAAFAADAARAAVGRFDVTVAFHAIPGFDVIFCADPSRANPAPLKRWLPRYAAYARLEREAFASGQLGRALLLSSAQLEGFARNTGAPRDRLTLLPPTVDRLRARPPTPEARVAARTRLGLGGEPVWLWMGLQPKTKGLDRALAALAATPDARLLVCGLDPASRGGAAMRRLAARLRLGARVTWLGFADDAGLAQATAAADVLVHPSRADVTGTVILEAMASGLPVITTALCGYGEHVIAAGAGIVLPEPFQAAALAAAVRTAPARALAWSTNALAYAGRDDLFSGLERAADLIAGARRGP
ncbi:MAG TPA: glycosyltransferase family 4 protein [Caulobacteraceae bacterium]|jgi:UDP-glucose:(heptosyl)LPS alpha-1,3-glucosyltransferase|nr:glycosyltransferase family 4 protein [Caulobacteraceae bacterium]